MPNNSAQRRTQFSSCDACRRSRVACDASKFGHQPGKVRWTGSCSRCSRRKRPCTFEWINKVKMKPSNPRQETTSHSPMTEPASFVSCVSHDQADFAAASEPFSRITQDCDPAVTQYAQPDVNIDVCNQSDLRQNAPLGESNIFVAGPNSTEPPSSQAESGDILLTRWSEQIFRHGFETIFSLLVGRNGCPFINDPNSDVCIPAMKLSRKLDTDLDDELDRQNPGYAPEVQKGRQESNYQINQSLSRAIQSFAARWFPLVSQNRLSTSQVEEIIRHSWRASRKDMLKVINRPSYRSALTLYLFAQTPIPVGISEDEELDGISGLLCIQTALLQVQRLRERQRSCQFDVSEVSGWADASATSAPNSCLTQAHLDFESRAYWAAVMWDTSSSLTLDLRTSLTSGLNGACSEPAWRLVKTWLVGSFHPETEHWRTNGIEISDEVASRIITAAAVCKLYVWKNITSLKEALREGVDEESVLFVWKALLAAIHMFQTSIRPLLNSCERRLHFMDQVNRLTWYEVKLQYYLGILVLVKAIEAANRSDLLPQLTEAREDAERESFNVLKFGMENMYTICGPDEDSNTASSFDTTADFPGESITASFVAIDPHPGHVVDAVLLMNEVIRRKYRRGNIKHEAYSYLSSVLLKALGQLPQSSKIVRAAKENLQRSLHKGDALGLPATDAAIRAS